MFKSYIDLIQEWLKKIGFSELAADSGEMEAAIFLVSLGLLGSIATAIWRLFKLWWRRREQLRLKEDLHPFFSVADIKKATQFYVPTHFQSNAPSQYQELSYSHKITARQRLLAFFFQTAFRPNNNDQRFYLILAGSGMGKTTFLINLYRRFLQRKRFGGIPFDIYLMPMASPKLFAHLEKIEDPGNSVLLLDGLDEDPEAVRNYKQRLKKVLDKVQDFRYVVFTCRTQFFPNEEEEPFETGVLRFGMHQGFLTFAKMYLAPFDERDIHRYLRKKYGRFNGAKKAAAMKIINHSPSLMVRPMILSYIDDLMEEPGGFVYTSHLYQTLIHKWIEREAMRVPEERRKKFRGELFRFSQEVALNMYKNRKLRQGLFLTQKDIGPFALKHKIDLEEMEMQSRSLLNRDSLGQYKFAHKSILEYFLAVAAVDDPVFGANFQFKGMDLARTFFDELCLTKTTLPAFEQLGTGATARLGDGPDRPVNEFSPVEIKQLASFHSPKLKRLEALRPIKSLQSLNLSNSGVRDTSPLQDLHYLTDLQLNQCPITDLRPLEGLHQLVCLEVANSRVHDLSPLRGLHQLQRLSVAHSEVDSLESLYELQELEVLHCEHTKVRDLNPIRRLRKLQVLSAHHNTISSLSPLRELSELQVLQLASTKVSNLSALRNLLQLRELYLASTSVSSLKGLKELSYLERLQLDYTDFREVGQLHMFPQLQWLSLRYLELDDLSPLWELPNLQTLILSKNQIPANEMIALRTKLPNCEVLVQ